MSGATSERERSSSSSGRREVSGRASGRASTEHSERIFGAAAASRLPPSSHPGSPVAAAGESGVGGREVVGVGVARFVEAAPHAALLRRC